MACARSDRTSAQPGGGSLVPLSTLPPGAHLRILYQGFPVDLRRAADGSVSALSLLCTHTACEVRWQGDDQRYHCPCHEGLFDEAGEVLAGPPPLPLRPVPVRIEGDQVRVG